MKTFILFLLFAASLTVNAQKQSLKELLYGGKLKLDSNSVIRKGDDLNAKIDTSTKKAPEPEKSKPVTVSDNSSSKKEIPTNDNVVAVVAAGDAANVETTDVKPNATPVKSNNKIWKEYAESLVATLKTEVLPSKKVKKEDYYITVDCEIAADGQVSITSVTAYPENTFLQDQVKERIVNNPPQLAPVVDSSNKPRKTKKKYNFNITKE